MVAAPGPGGFICVLPYVPHQETSANDADPLSCVLVGRGQEPVVGRPEEVHWVDNRHAAPKA